MTDVPYLFKYMPYRKEFFENFYLRCTPRSALNDPFELRPSDQYMRDHTWDLLAQREMTPETELSEELLDFNSGFLKRAFNKMGIVSFSETNDNLLMWSHYADNHRGIVVTFNTSHDFFKKDGSKSRQLGRVQYRKDRMKAVPLALKNGFHMSDSTRIYFEKSDEWIYEKEHRLICDLYASNDTLCSTEYYDEKLRHKYPNYNPEPATKEMVSLKDIEARYNIASDPEVLCMLEVPKDCIRSVTCGALMAPSDKEYVKAKAEEFNFVFIEAKIDESEYRLNFVTV
ncbi:DUF2971 domain-containing protein [Thalassolituus oleivorans]|uniref:DUF2971 domain-containing protein n=1 Tax=Thalassolituus oleivorans TaxID=187493 RepID=UPI001CE2A11A|nr:DUF2971 domain-containing protein [Thalassolituus oleivorans]MCA6129139.1 hypothetical protein [Thalassolituus oleivorans 4BN06-13]